MATLQFTEGQQAPSSVVNNAKQLLPNVVDGVARTRPEALYALIPQSFTTYMAGYRKVTYLDLANTVNGVAWLLLEQLGRGVKAKPLAYIGPNDIGYVVMILGAAKAGYSILSLSPRNTKRDHASLLASTQCDTILTLPPPYAASVHTVIEGLGCEPRIVHVPTIYQLLDEKSSHFPYPVTFDAVQHEPLVIVHTSGSTGTPKPVKYSHALAASYNWWVQEPPPDKYFNSVALVQSNRVFVTFPFFHAGCLYMSLFDAIANQTTVVTPLAGIPLSAALIIEGMKLVDVDALLAPAPFAEQIAKNRDMLHYVVEHVRTVGYGGGDLSESAGNAFASRVHVVSFNGSTETTSYPGLRSSDDYSAQDWKYLRLHPCANMTFERSGESDLFEAVLKRNAEVERRQPVFTIFPDLEEYRTRDLFSPHPQKPEFWMYRGRVDDMIIAATGALCNPVPVEQAIAATSEVAAALVVGTGRYRKALIVEPTDEQWCEPCERAEFVDRIWPAIDRVNQDIQKANRIARSHILVTAVGRPLQRAGKGTVQRSPSLLLYKPQVDELYEREGDEMDAEGQPFEVHIQMRTEPLEGVHGPK